ncbi:MAG: hypothetical protein HY540_04990 [Deltaproteobacteria bacterium]|nr:hypothetical protein [Deltaproteobacteria bacterium]
MNFSPLQVLVGQAVNGFALTATSSLRVPGLLNGDIVGSGPAPHQFHDSLTLWNRIFSPCTRAAIDGNSVPARWNVPSKGIEYPQTHPGSVVVRYEDVDGEPKFRADISQTQKVEPWRRIAIMFSMRQPSDAAGVHTLEAELDFCEGGLLISQSTAVTAIPVGQSLQWQSSKDTIHVAMRGSWLGEIAIKLIRDRRDGWQTLLKTMEDGMYVTPRSLEQLAAMADATADSAHFYVAGAEVVDDLILKKQPTLQGKNRITLRGQVHSSPGQATWFSPVFADLFYGFADTFRFTGPFWRDDDALAKSKEAVNLNR